MKNSLFRGMCERWWETPHNAQADLMEWAGSWGTKRRTRENKDSYKHSGWCVRPDCAVIMPYYPKPVGTTNFWRPTRGNKVNVTKIKKDLEKDRAVKTGGCTEGWFCVSNPAKIWRNWENVSCTWDTPHPQWHAGSPLRWSIFRFGYLVSFCVILIENHICLRMRPTCNNRLLLLKTLAVGYLPALFPLLKFSHPFTQAWTVSNPFSTTVGERGQLFPWTFLEDESNQKVRNSTW